MNALAALAKTKKTRRANEQTNKRRVLLTATISNRVSDSVDISGSLGVVMSECNTNTKATCEESLEFANKLLDDAIKDKNIATQLIDHWSFIVREHERHLREKAND